MPEKPLIFRGRSLATLRSFPEDVKDDIGFELYLVQIGEMPSDFKRMRAIGPGVYEIRCKAVDGEYRVFYVAVLDDAVHVLHAFQKKSRKTSQNDIATGRRNYKHAAEQAMIRRRRE